MTEFEFIIWVKQILLIKKSPAKMHGTNARGTTLIPVTTDSS